MDYVKVVLALLSAAKWIMGRIDYRTAFKAGQRDQLVRSLAETARRAGLADEVIAEVAAMSRAELEELAKR